MSEAVARATVEAVVPDGPPRLDEVGWRALLRVLTGAAEAELGSEWRSVLAGGAEAIG